MKPHEEEWGFTHASGEWISRDGGAGPIIFSAHGSVDDIKARSALAAAAPEMARALVAALAHGGNARWIDEDGMERDLKRDIRVALAKAGVPCP